LEIVMEKVEGYMAFMATAPLIGLPIHPAYSPVPPDEETAEGWARAYQVFESRDALLEDINSSHEELMEAVEDGNLEDADDPDEAFPVRVYADGRVDVLDPAGEQGVLYRYTAAQMFDAFGMESPEAVA
jgi:hypothetical protein